MTKHHLSVLLVILLAGGILAFGVVRFRDAESERHAMKSVGVKSHADLESLARLMDESTKSRILTRADWALLTRVSREGPEARDSVAFALFVLRNPEDASRAVPLLTEIARADPPPLLLKEIAPSWRKDGMNQAADELEAALRAQGVQGRKRSRLLNNWS